MASAGNNPSLSVSRKSGKIMLFYISFISVTLTIHSLIYCSSRSGSI